MFRYGYFFPGIYQLARNAEKNERVIFPDIENDFIFRKILLHPVTYL